MILKKGSFRRFRRKLVLAILMLAGVGIAVLTVFAMWDLAKTFKKTADMGGFGVSQGSTTYQDQFNQRGGDATRINP